MEDTSKPKEEMPEEPSEGEEEEQIDEPQPEAKSEEPQDESTEEPDVQEKVEETAEETGESSKESEEKVDIAEEPAKAEKKQEKGKKQAKAEVKKEKPKVDRGPDFKYIVRLSNTDVDGEKSVVYGLTSVKGIGVQMATLIADETGIDRNMKIGDLKDPQIEKLQETIDNVSKNAPGWMLNHRKNYETGEDIHLIGSDIDMQLRDEINIMKKIRSYRGVRHELGLSVRGQRTGSNSRKGLALGVSKRKVESK